MQGNIVLGCSGWNYPDTPDKGGWTEIFYPDKSTKRLLHYSQSFDTAEMDSTFYNRFYSRISITKWTTPVKVPHRTSFKHDKNP